MGSEVRIAGKRIDIDDIPTLKQMGIHPETWELAREISALGDDDGLSLGVLELLVRVVTYSEKVRRHK